MKDLKFQITIPTEKIEGLIEKALREELDIWGAVVKFQGSHESKEALAPTPVEDAAKQTAKQLVGILKETAKEGEVRKEHWTKQLEKSLLTRLIAFRCDCGHITWRLCKDGNFDCECNKCGTVHKWDILELHRLDYSCKCGYRKYLYMPLSHHIEELRCGECKAPIDIKFNEKAKRFDQLK